MHRSILVLALTAFFLANPNALRASGSQAPYSGSRGFGRPDSSNERQAANSAASITISRPPYDLGKAIFAGKYNLGNPKLSKANVDEKELRLASLQRLLAPAEAKKIQPTAWAPRLTNQEMNAFEYFLIVRFSKILNKPASWAKDEPPVKIVFAN